MEQPPLGFIIAEGKNQTVLKTKQVKKLAAPSVPSNLLPNLLPNLSPDLFPNLGEQNLRRKLGRIEGKKQATERFKGEITYALFFCVLGESFRGGGVGGPGGIKIIELILKTFYKTCVPQVKT